MEACCLLTVAQPFSLRPVKVSLAKRPGSPLLFLSALAEAVYPGAEDRLRFIAQNCRTGPSAVPRCAHACAPRRVLHAGCDLVLAFRG